MTPAHSADETRSDTGEISRRTFVTAGVTGGIAAAAGCLGTGGGGDGDGGDDDGNDSVPEDVDPDRVLDGVVLDTAFPVRLVDASTDEVLTDIHHHPDEEARHWHRAPVTVPVDERRTIVVQVNNHEGETVSLGRDGELRVEVEPTGRTPRDLVDLSVDGDLLELYGNRVGDGRFAFRLRSDGEQMWAAPPLPVRVE